ncbi:uncharacterized protein HD556DRAFT_1383634 [Suillus plorans]|uniref:Uncharacterized protein n=1 Tax=Suillus plorans TaxID=116603 RepID=A0A9P7AMR3_9AGAM|nr:uncharacterized protein HD556DRAFT_1383634 [Suillus plorans]KAG1791901.1 hypothetical protein HD556DRAFT_1383634 [Suillus plorans]
MVTASGMNLCQIKYRLLLWAGQEVDGSMQTKTPSHEEVCIFMSTFCDSTFPLFGEANEATIPFAPPETPVLFSYFATDSHLWAILNAEITHENPVEDRHRRLVQSHRSRPCDRELKLNAKIRDEPDESKKPRRFALMTSFYAIIGNTQLCTLSACQLRGERPHLEVSFLPRPGQARAYQIPQICHLARSFESEASSGGAWGRAECY